MTQIDLAEAIDWVASFERLNATEAPPYKHGRALIAEINRLQAELGDAKQRLHEAADAYIRLQRNPNAAQGRDEGGMLIIP